MRVFLFPLAHVFFLSNFRQQKERAVEKSQHLYGTTFPPIREGGVEKSDLCFPRDAAFCSWSRNMEGRVYSFWAVFGFKGLLVFLWRKGNERDGNNTCNFGRAEVKYWRFSTWHEQEGRRGTDYFLPHPSSIKWVLKTILIKRSFLHLGAHVILWYFKRVNITISVLDSRYFNIHEFDRSHLEIIRTVDSKRLRALEREAHAVDIIGIFLKFHPKKGIDHRALFPTKSKLNNPCHLTYYYYLPPHPSLLPLLTQHQHCNLPYLPTKHTIRKTQIPK